MSDAKHTPGPWQIRRQQQRGRFAISRQVISIVGMPTNTFVSERVLGHDFNGSSEANAALIAAAPDLLAVCQELVDHFDYGLEDLEAALERIAPALRAAVLRATGQEGR